MPHEILLDGNMRRIHQNEHCAGSSLPAVTAGAVEWHGSINSRGQGRTGGHDSTRGRCSRCRRRT
eukprot:2456164-Prymnesium_polylepis.2